MRDTDKSRYFAIIEFNKCFIIQSGSSGNDVPFSLEIVVPITHERNICSKTHVHDTTHEQTIIARHVMGSRPMGRKKNASSDKNIYLLVKSITVEPPI